MFKRLGKDAYICDTKEDLKQIAETELGAECYVIKESCKYLLMSDGEWAKQGGAAAGTGAEVDLTGYATEDFVAGAKEEAVVESKAYTDKKIGTIKIPSVSNFVKKEDLQGYATDAEVELLRADIQDMKFASNNDNESFEMYGLKLSAADGKSLHDTIKDLGLCGFKTLWVQKGVEDLPEEMKSNNQSGRGFFCCDYWNNENDFIAWIQLFVKDGSVYTGFLNHGAEIIWKKLV